MAYEKIDFTQADLAVLQEKIKKIGTQVTKLNKTKENHRKKVKELIKNV